MIHGLYPIVNRGPPRPSRVLTPQGYARRSGHERTVVAGGGVVVLDVGQGDLISVINDEGGQVCEMVAAGSDGKIDAQLIGQVANSTSDGLKAMLGAGGVAGAGIGKLRQGLMMESTENRG